MIDDPRGILLGSAVEDAYVGEAQQAWAGAMITPTARDFADSRGYVERFVELHLQAAAEATDEVTRKNARLNSNRLARYPVPTQVNPKDGPVQYGEIDTYAIDWTVRMYAGAAQASFDASPNPHSSAIAANTCKFEQWARTR